MGGTILTMAKSAAAPEVVVIAGGRITAVGAKGILDAFPDAFVHDLSGRTLCPGFIDAHHHLSLAALHPCWADLRGVTDEEGLARALEEQARRQPETPWIRAAGWSDVGSRFQPHRRQLDALGLDRPVLVAHYSLHQGVTDSRGLDSLGIGSSTPDPPGGSIGKDPDGTPNGLLVERAWSEAHRRSVAPYADPERWSGHIVTAARALWREGITAVHDTACSPEAERAYRMLADGGDLPLSVLACPHPASLFAPPEEDRLRGGPRTGEGDEWLRMGPVKLFADGGVAPAIDVHLQGQRVTFGALFVGLAEAVELAVSLGYRVAVHALGNAGLEEALGAFRASARRHPDEDSRFRVEHACLASAGQLRRLAALGGIAVVQPAFLDHLGRQVEGVVFDDAQWLPFAAIVQAGVTMVGSSDGPCTFSHPLAGAHLGVTRRTGTGAVLDQRQSVPLHEWIRAYTAHAAYAGGQEHERGSLEAGKRADLVVLDGPLVEESPPGVAQTWVAGELVFDAGRPPTGAGAVRR